MKFFSQTFKARIDATLYTKRAIIKREEVISVYHHSFIDNNQNTYHNWYRQLYKKYQDKFIIS